MIYIKNNFRKEKRSYFIRRTQYFYFIMHFDAITHTQKAIQSLRAEFKLFLKKNHQQALPLISHKSRISHSLQSQVPLKNINRSKSRYEPSNDNQVQKTKNVNTISFLSNKEQQKIQVVIIKPRSRKMTKLILPRFIKNSNSNIIKHNGFKESLQNIESSLVYQPEQCQSPEKQFLSQIGSPQRRKILNKTNSQNKQIQRQLKKGSMPIINLDKVYTSRQNCFSPWQDKEQEVETLQF